MNDIDQDELSPLYAARMTIAEAADQCYVTPGAIYRWHNPGLAGVRLGFTRIGGRTYVLRRDLEAFIAARSDPEPAPSKAESDREFMQRAAAAQERTRKLLGGK